MLTKEECYIALNDMYDSTLLSKDDCKGNCKILAQLIEEHFSNPPLKIKEIQNYMWIWDKQEEEWLLVDDKWKENNKEYLRVHSIYEYDAVCEFEPNRFYRKEVQE